MEAMALTYSSIIERPKLVKVYSGKKPVLKRIAKVKPFYPRVLMPEQPTGYIKQREIDCW